MGGRLQTPALPPAAGPTLPIPPRHPLTLQPLRNTAAMMTPRSAGSDHQEAASKADRGPPRGRGLGAERGGP